MSKAPNPDPRPIDPRSEPEKMLMAPYPDPDKSEKASVPESSANPQTMSEMVPSNDSGDFQTSTDSDDVKFQLIKRRKYEMKISPEKKDTAVDQKLPTKKNPRVTRSASKKILKQDVGNGKSSEKPKSVVQPDGTKEVKKILEKEVYKGQYSEEPKTDVKPKAKKEEKKVIKGEVDRVKATNPIRLQSDGTKVWSRLIEDQCIASNSINFFSELEKFEAHVSLSQAQLEFFKTTCFGKFLGLTKIKKSAKLVNDIILRLVDVKNSGSDELHFELGGSLRTFNKCDFSLITGLKCDGETSERAYANAELDGRLFNKYFGGGKHTKRETISLNASRQKSCSDEDRVKLALIYFVSNILLGSPGSVKIPSFYCKLVDNLDVFNNFPWGTIAWEFMCDQMRSIVQKESLRAYPNCESTKFNLKGFLLPLQIWAYETIPSLEANGFCRSVSRSHVPRMLCWEAVEVILDNKLKTLGLGSSQLEFNPIIPRPHEMDGNQLLTYSPEVIKGDQNGSILVEIGRLRNHFDEKLGEMSKELLEMKSIVIGLKELMVTQDKRKKKMKKNKKGEVKKMEKDEDKDEKEESEENKGEKKEDDKEENKECMEDKTEEKEDIIPSYQIEMNTQERTMMWETY